MSLVREARSGRLSRTGHRSLSLFGIDRRQAGVLSDRYLDVMLGDLGACAMLLVQAPVIGVLVAGVWANASNDTLTLYFVLCLSAFFLGAINSAREIVKERALFLRERMFNLSLGAYLYSKYRVLTMLVILQCVLLLAVVRAFVPLKVNAIAVGATLALTGVAGTAVGLVISAWASSPDRAVALVPLVVIPQILFSDFVLGEKALSNWAGTAAKGMPVRWSYDVLKALRDAEVHYDTVIGGAVVLISIVLVCFMLAQFLLWRAEY